MYSHHGLNASICSVARQRHIIPSLTRQTRSLHHDGRNRLSGFWTPTKSKTQDSASLEDSHDLLVRGGFLRQAHSGIFHLLPLGLRVQNKVEALIDKHMAHLSATKVSLSSISSEELWQRSGRLEGRDSEFLRLQDRKGAKYLLSPTHEEEITEIVASSVNSYKDLPLRLYQVTRKYRDEARPRQGLLRGREFLMKDLYTFDVTEEEARATYDQVRKAYSAFFEELNLPYLVANADSGSMGGNLSHEYHLASANGEDNIISCKKCDYSTNEELYSGALGPHELSQPDSSSVGRDMNSILTSTPFLSKDKTALFNIITPKDSGPLNTHLLKKLHPTIDTTLESPFKIWSALNTKNPTRARTETQILDGRLAHLPLSNPTGPTIVHKNTALTSPSESSTCPSCLSPSSLQISTAIEIGHTFHLGTRYSVPLNAQVLSSNNKLAPISMGCHGIGVSRLLAAAAGLLMDSKGLNWPVKIAPFGAVVVAAPKTASEDANKVYDILAMGKVETPAPKFSQALEDYQMQLKMLDEQNKKRFATARSSRDNTPARTPPSTADDSLEDQWKQLKFLDEQHWKKMRVEPKDLVEIADRTPLGPPRDVRNRNSDWANLSGADRKREIMKRIAMRGTGGSKLGDITKSANAEAEREVNAKEKEKETKESSASSPAPSLSPLPEPDSNNPPPTTPTAPAPEPSSPSTPAPTPSPSPSAFFYPLDVAIDDRDRPLGWKLNDADLIGYPFIIVLGKAWKARGAVEVQCRRLGVKEEVSLEELVGKVKGWGEKL